jgi:large subunit ribosomal protein L3
MALGVIGRKCGMTRIFTEDGLSIPVTVIEAQPNRVTQLKTKETDGYEAVQVTCGTRRAKRVNKPKSGQFKKAGVEAGRGFWEFRIENEDLDLQLGNEIKVDIFNDGQFVDVTGTSKGKGFAGAIKRHNFSMQDATHGNSLAHRSAGSIGQNQTPATLRFANKVVKL